MKLKRWDIHQMFIWVDEEIRNRPINRKTTCPYEMRDLKKLRKQLQKAKEA